eukprot:TRINITY_DN5469_c0_g1_i2.p1 TRINITY_DN5469_c0_g1~~TRINITY_DN5469_c0_g1_i2.p1  ORF type:complete len:350 (-),score=89.19 TRINITY_DN5469_c0_g1_i2:515-1564(-)
MAWRRRWLSTSPHTPPQRPPPPKIQPTHNKSLQKGAGRIARMNSKNVTFPNASITKLQNGVKIMTLPTNHELSRVAAFVAAGARYEQTYERGLAHFVEHVLTSNSQQFSYTETVGDVHKRGGDIYAQTDRELAQYGVDFYSSDMSKSVEILANIVLHEAALEPEYVKREKELVYHEISTQSDLFLHLHQGLYHTAYPNSSPDSSIMGSLLDIRAIDASMVKKFYRGRYTPDKMAVVAMGKVDHSKVVEAVSKRFESLPSALENSEEQQNSSYFTVFHPAVARQPIKGANYLAFAIGFHHAGSMDANFTQLLMLAELLRSEQMTPLGQRLGMQNLLGKQDELFVKTEPTA